MLGEKRFSYPTIITIMWSRLIQRRTQNKKMKNENDDKVCNEKFMKNCMQISGKVFFGWKSFVTAMWKTSLDYCSVCTISKLGRLLQSKPQSCKVETYWVHSWTLLQKFVQSSSPSTRMQMHVEVLLGNPSKCLTIHGEVSILWFMQASAGASRSSLND